MEFCLGLQLRSLAGQCLDRDWWNHATLLTLNTTQRWGLMTALGSSDSLSTISWNICLPEMYWIHNTYERPYLVFITYLIGKEVVLRNLSEWRNVSREWEVDKKLIFVVKVTHYDSLSKVTVSPWGKSCHKLWKWSACCFLPLTCRKVLVFADDCILVEFVFIMMFILLLREVEIKKMISIQFSKLCQIPQS